MTSEINPDIVRGELEKARRQIASGMYQGNNDVIALAEVYLQQVTELNQLRAEREEIIAALQFFSASYEQVKWKCIGNKVPTYIVAGKSVNELLNKLTQTEQKEGV